MKFSENDRVVAKIPCLDESDEVFVVDVRGKVKEYDDDAGVVLIDTGRTTITVLDEFVELEVPAEATESPENGAGATILRLLEEQAEAAVKRRDWPEFKRCTDLFVRLKEAG